MKWVGMQWECIVIWLGLGLYLMFAITIHIRNFKFFYCLCFGPPSWPSVSLSAPPQKDSASCSTINCNALPLDWTLQSGAGDQSGWERGSILILYFSLLMGLSLLVWPSQIIPPHFQEDQRGYNGVHALPQLR